MHLELKAMARKNVDLPSTKGGPPTFTPLLLLGKVKLLDLVHDAAVRDSSFLEVNACASELPDHLLSFPFVLPVQQDFVHDFT